jgi:hypothetical protein
MSLRRTTPMLKAATVFAIGIALLLGNVMSARAVSIISGDGTETCSGPAGCPTVATVSGLNPAWQGNNPTGDGAVWVSYNAGTGNGGVNNLSDSILAAGATFSEVLPSGPGTLALSVWADDTARVSVTGFGVLSPAAGTAPNFSQDVCAHGKLGCEANEQGEFSVLLGSGPHTLNIEVFQVGGISFGALWSGTFTPSELTPVPEPASILLLGSALAAAGVASRRRWLKK